nr:G protein-coupled receptor [Proales similis]
MQEDMHSDLNASNQSDLCPVASGAGFQSSMEFEVIIYGPQGFVLWGVVFVLIAALGCIGNVLTIVVLKRDPMMSTLTILLIALALSDMMAPLANALVAVSFYHLSGKYENSVEYLKFNDILRHIIQPLSTMFTMCSSWIVTLTTLFRLIAVVKPLKARALITKRCTVVCLTIIFGCSLASIMPIYASLIRRVKCTSDRQQQYVAFDIQITSQMMAKAYLPLLQTLCFYLPWLIALALWLCLLRTLKRSERNFKSSLSARELSTITAHGAHQSSTMSASDRSRKKRLSKENKNGQQRQDDSMRSDRAESFRFGIHNVEKRQRCYNKITLMVVVLCFTNLICRVFTFVFIFEVIYNEWLRLDPIDSADGYETSNIENYDPRAENARTHFPKFLAYSLLLNNIFLCLNHSSNIIIYTGTNPRFRRNLVSLITPKWLSDRAVLSERKARYDEHLPNERACR